MCGISGWVDFERDLREERATLGRMTETLASRGPDDGGHYLAHHVALGHRRLAIIDLAGGKQPMVHEAAGGDVVLVYTGEVYNFAELRSELVARGHAFRSASDTEVVLRGYLEWGEGVARRLNGMYAFAVWDARTQSLLLVRDRLGIKPLYYFETKAGILFGSEPKAIFASGVAAPAVGEEGLCALLSLVRAPGEAIYKGMKELPPGEILHYRRDRGAARTRYWALEPREHRDDLATTIATVKELLERSVRSHLVADVPLCALLSGGLDSSVITALAQRERVATGSEPLRSVTVDFAKAAGETGATGSHRDDMRATDDLPYVREVLAHLGTEHQVVTVDASALAGDEAWAATMRARDLPPLGDMDTSLYLMCKAIRAHSTVALSGEGADELFGGYPWFHDPGAVQEETFPWLVAGGRLGRQAVFEPRLRGRTSVRDYQATQYREALAGLPRLPGEDAPERRMREISYLHMTRFLPTPLDRKDRLSMAVGLEVRVPYCDTALVEYVFNVPWAMKAFDGREKSLLRAVARGLLPASVVERKKAAFPTTQDPRYHDRLRTRVNALLGERDPPVLSVLSRASVRALANMPATGSQIVRLGLERVLRIDEWLRTYEVRVDG